ncbi:hypothetical protein ACIRBX_11170 [Kitasatospora sp. NPDC096147]|uniref:hypothetical protein n=1 Tax=Kitasatospora sp. NPDC096147 TaxID=3364093 RepID=UPI0037FA66C2
MSYSTPPGWYPVLEPGPDGAARERRWDGAAWTDDYRPAGEDGGPGAPGGTSAGADGLGGAGGGTEPPEVLPQPLASRTESQPPAPRTGVLVVTGLVVLLLCAATAVWLGRGDGGSEAQLPLPPVPVVSGTSPGPSPATSSPASTASSTPTISSPTPSPEPTSAGPGTPAPTPAQPTGPPPLQSFGSVPDTTHGWRVPLPAGWKSTPPSGGKALVVFTTRPYECSIGSGNCSRGVFQVMADAFDGASAQAVAEERMAGYATMMFERLSSHRRLASGPVTVAGVPGYAERWQVDPVTGPNGQVITVAVPAVGGGYAILVGSVDEHPDAPPLDILDQLVAAIRPLSPQLGAG